MELGDCRLLIGRDGDDGLSLMKQTTGGGAACDSTRQVLRGHGAIVMGSSDGQRVLVTGIVADDVTAVRVGDVPAYLRNNAFVAAIGRDDSPLVVTTTPTGEREVGPEPP